MAKQEKRRIPHERIVSFDDYNLATWVHQIGSLYTRVVVVQLPRSVEVSSGSSMDLIALSCGSSLITPSSSAAPLGYCFATFESTTTRWMELN